MNLYHVHTFILTNVDLFFKQLFKGLGLSVRHSIRQTNVSDRFKRFRSFLCSIDLSIGDNFKMAHFVSIVNAVKQG